jgi:hypothetical protein
VTDRLRRFFLFFSFSFWGNEIERVKRGRAEFMNVREGGRERWRAEDYS